PYLLYFTLPGNERYYTYTKGPVQFFVIDSTPDDDDLLCCDSEQSIWLKSELANSDATFKIVYFHHAPYSTGDHGSDEDMQWPFEEWGAHAVLTGHEHIYQRIYRKDNPDFMYIVCGVSGKSDEDCGKEDLEDEDDFEVICIDDVHGAMKILVTEEKMTFQFWTVEEPDEPMDEYVLDRSN
ncbi:MAG: metallophosphoesterase, partial [Saprospiraceae bacterium]